MVKDESKASVDHAAKQVPKNFLYLCFFCAKIVVGVQCFFQVIWHHSTEMM